MSIELKIPSVGESVTQVTIAQWLKQDGEYVEMDEAIAELESDKATVTSGWCVVISGRLVIRRSSNRTSCERHHQTRRCGDSCAVDSSGYRRPEFSFGVTKRCGATPCQQQSGFLCMLAEAESSGHAQLNVLACLYEKKTKMSMKKKTRHSPNGAVVQLVDALQLTRPDQQLVHSAGVAADKEPPAVELPATQAVARGFGETGSQDVIRLGSHVATKSAAVRLCQCPSAIGGPDQRLVQWVHSAGVAAHRELPTVERPEGKDDGLSSARCKPIRRKGA